MSIKVALLVAQVGFRKEELYDTKQILEDSGVEVIIVANEHGVATDHTGGTISVDCTVQELNPSDYLGCYIIGGEGTMEYLDTPQVYRLLNEFFALGKSYGAICIAPRILAKAQVLINIKATCWNGDGKVQEIFKEYGAIYDPSQVVTDGMVVTADSPSAARAFGIAIIDAIAG